MRIWKYLYIVRCRCPFPYIQSTLIIRIRARFAYNVFCHIISNVLCYDYIWSIPFKYMLSYISTKDFCTSACDNHRRFEFTFRTFTYIKYTHIYIIQLHSTVHKATLVAQVRDFKIQQCINYEVASINFVICT